MSPLGSRTANFVRIGVLAKEDAVPLLAFHLEDTVGRIKERWRTTNYVIKPEEPLDLGEDGSFLNALVLSLTDVGPPALDEVARLNRQASKGGFPPRSLMLESTSKIIFKILQENPKISESANFDLSGVVIHSVQFGHETVKNLPLRGMKLFNIGGCGAGLSSADLSGSRLISSYFESGDLSNSILGATEFSDVNLSGANLDFVSAYRVNFGKEYGAGSNLEYASFKNAHLENANFQNALISFGDFKSSTMTFSNLEEAVGFGASFQDADPRGAVLVKGDFRNASFKGTNLEGAIFISPQEYLERPAEPQYRTPVPDGINFGWSALVDGADFSGAMGVDEQTRVYICSFGGKNVPGGCEDTNSWGVTFDYKAPVGSFRCF